MRSVIVKDIHTRAVGQLHYENSEWSMPKLKIDFSVGGAKSNFRGLKDGGTYFNEALSALIPAYIDEIWPEVEPMLVEDFQEVVLRFVVYFLFFL